MMYNTHIYIYINAIHNALSVCVCLLDYVCKLRSQRLGSDKDQEISVKNKKILVMYLLESNRGSNGSLLQRR